MLLSGIALIVLSPILVVLMILGAIFMHGNPFFIYPRVGKNEKVFKLIKFRSMAELKDESGEYLPDEVRLFCRKGSLDDAAENSPPEVIGLFESGLPNPVLEHLPVHFVDGH